MNRWILTAGALSTLTIFLHLIGGGTDVHQPILKGGLSVELNAYASILWHAVSIVIAVNSVALLVAAVRPEVSSVLVYIVASQYLAFAALFLFYGVVRLGSIFIMPQWTLFIAISALALFGLIAKTRKQNP